MQLVLLEALTCAAMTVKSEDDEKITDIMWYKSDVNYIENSPRKIGDIHESDIGVLEGIYFKPAGNQNWNQIGKNKVFQEYLKFEKKKGIKIVIPSKDNDKQILINKVLEDYENNPFKYLMCAFQTQIPLSAVCAYYQYLCDKYILDSEDNDSSKNILKNEFYKKYGKPLDKVLSEKLNEYFNGKYKASVRNDTASRSSKKLFVDIYKGEEAFDLNILSTGEKIMIGIIVLSVVLKLVHTERSENYSKLLLLDEPDAHLHPELSYKLINLINRYIVNELGIKVVMVTHSPNTISVCPEENIFELNDKHVLKKVEKASLIERLTKGIPPGLNYSNKIIVFTEANDDKIFLNDFWSSCGSCFGSDVDIVFETGGNGELCSSEVRKLVSSMRKQGGFKNVFGVIDRDKKSKTNKINGIFVLGDGERYCLESYVYDPLMLVLFMKYGEVSQALLSRELKNNKSLIANIFNNQEMLNKEILLISQKVLNYEAPETIVTKPVIYPECFGIKVAINLPTKYLDLHGHCNSQTDENGNKVDGLKELVYKNIFSKLDTKDDVEEINKKYKKFYKKHLNLMPESLYKTIKGILDTNL